MLSHVNAGPEQVVSTAEPEPEKIVTWTSARHFGPLIACRSQQK